MSNLITFQNSLIVGIAASLLYLTINNIYESIERQYDAEKLSKLTAKLQDLDLVFEDESIEIIDINKNIETNKIHDILNNNITIILNNDQDIKEENNKEENNKEENNKEETNKETNKEILYITSQEIINEINHISNEFTDKTKEIENKIKEEIIEKAEDKIKEEIIEKVEDKIKEIINETKENSVEEQEDSQEEQEDSQEEQEDSQEEPESVEDSIEEGLEESLELEDINEEEEE